MATKTEWQPNAKQSLFMEVLKEHDTDGKGLTLAQVNEILVADGKEPLVSGTVNCLSGKGLVSTRKEKVEKVIKRKTEVTFYSLSKGE